MTQPRKLDADCLNDCLIARALSGLYVGLILTDSSGRVIWLNRAARTLLGLPGTDCLGQPLERLLRDLQLIVFWQKAVETEGNVLGDVAVNWPESLALKVNATRYVDDQGRELGRALLLCDVTAEREVQVKLSQSVAERLLALTAGHMPPKPVAHLTHQELRILRLVGRGMSNEEIGEKAGVSSSTVRSHLKNLYRKLGLNSRTEAVSYAVRNHLA
ncbi:MAG: LuxR C-terminal-related transcriptional regulator [Planctomycetota bacterium]